MALEKISLSVDALSEFLAEEGLTEAYATQAVDYYLPALAKILSSISAGDIRVLGINGSQGSGKSTLAKLLRWTLERELGWRVAELSIDDFYLSKSAREALAVTEHPLLRTRGVPGTHDVVAAKNLIQTLRALRDGESVALPRFDKSMDDIAPPQSWPVISGPIDLIIFEGWCVGASPQTDTALDAPLNELELREDASGSWRRYVNTSLAGEYQALFAEVDYLLMLRAPSFDCVLAWRQEQEAKLRQRRENINAPGVMSPAAVARFIQHYERITRSCLSDLGAAANCVIDMDARRQVRAVQYNMGEQGVGA